jgi:hypothetical protein
MFSKVFMDIPAPFYEPFELFERFEQFDPFELFEPFFYPSSPLNHFSVGCPSMLWA